MGDLVLGGVLLGGAVLYGVVLGGTVLGGWRVWDGDVFFLLNFSNCPIRHFWTCIILGGGFWRCNLILAVQFSVVFWVVLFFEV